MGIFQEFCWIFIKIGFIEHVDFQESKMFLKISFLETIFRFKDFRKSSIFSEISQTKIVRVQPNPKL